MPKFRGVEGGTPSGEPLCRTCMYAHYTSGARVSDTNLFCQVINRFLKSEKYGCSQYMDKRRASLDDMYKTAWYLRTDEFHKSIGFVSPREWRLKFRQNEDDGDSPV
jgi:hypothetical protein